MFDARPSEVDLEGGDHVYTYIYIYVYICILLQSCKLGAVSHCPGRSTNYTRQGLCMSREPGCRATSGMAVVCLVKA